jgi:formylglycine-generating enzyme required for sulfatase activity
VAFSCQGVGNGIGEMVQVPAGEFLMGCNTAVDAECRGDEQPSHTVFVSDFQIDKLEVTQGMYAACVQAKKCTAPSCDWDCNLSNNPAGCVTRDQAMTYCAWAGKRLPTEAEWEKAARGTDGRKFPWGNDAPTCDLAAIAGCTQTAEAAGSHPAGASPYGALDMAGNMVEMLADWYDPGYYQVMPTSDPKGPATGTTYVGRGGGWKSDPTWQRTSVRDWYEPADAGRSLGFRCAR